MDRKHSADEEVAASAVAFLSSSMSSASSSSRSSSSGSSWGWKREREGSQYDTSTALSDERPVKTSRKKGSFSSPPAEKDTDNTEDSKPASLQPAPFYYYRDFSEEPDDDPLTLLTPPARVPNFPAKMHAILSRPDLTDVVAWLPHGRAWRVIKPREFEVRVIPTYFEHAKFSSFIRQANGWGFRRIMQGRDRNAYYNERFLRGMPHLCKKMKRPGVHQKIRANPDHEPDFYKISEMHPIPEKALDDEGTRLQCVIDGGPKARMPVNYAAILAQNAATSAASSSRAPAAVGIKSVSDEDKKPAHKPAENEIVPNWEDTGSLVPIQQAASSSQPASHPVLPNNAGSEEVHHASRRLIQPSVENQSLPASFLPQQPSLLALSLAHEQAASVYGGGALNQSTGVAPGAASLAQGVPGALEQGFPGAIEQDLPGALAVALANAERTRLADFALRQQQAQAAQALQASQAMQASQALQASTAAAASLYAADLAAIRSMLENALNAPTDASLQAQALGLQLLTQEPGAHSQQE